MILKFITVGIMPTIDKPSVQGIILLFSKLLWMSDLHA